MSQDFRHLIEKYLVNSLTAEEEQQLAMLSKDEDNRGLLEEMIEEDLRDGAYAGEENVPLRHLSFARLLSKMDAPRRIPRYTWIRYAAAVILIVGVALVVRISLVHRKEPGIERPEALGKNDVMPGRSGAVLTLGNGLKLLLDSVGNGVVGQQGATKVRVRDGRLVYEAGAGQKEIFYNTMTTPKARVYQVILPDGTLALLNAASSITYPTAFTGNERRVSITGEVYFEVAKDSRRPMRVDVDHRMEIAVLGTSFNVNSYADEGKIRTTLLDGSVKAAGVVLQPGQQVIMQSGAAGIGKPQLLSAVDVGQVMAWKNGLFNFNGADLSTVLRQLQRWYDIDIQYEGVVPVRTFRGKITRDLNLSEVLKLLETVGVRFRLEGRRLIVTG